MTANTPRTRKEKGNRAERIVATAYRQTGLFPNAQSMPMSGAMQFHKGDIFKGEYDIFVDEVSVRRRFSYGHGGTKLCRSVASISSQFYMSPETTAQCSQ